ncbi:hypothetical protein [Subtercola boreus]|uniref:hypothetical protein n=1 Tax=Subtercola boreus TaxID=120213 RepID=UPI0015589B3B|nr:hypothetical protein [Subtercola boreus]
MRVFVYSFAVTVMTAVGLFVIGVLQFPLLNPGSTISDAIGSMAGVLAFAAFIVLPALLFYMLAVAGVIGVIRRRTWWAGALAGLIPALLLYGLLALMDSGATYIGTAEELHAADVIKQVFAVLSVCWCTVAGTSLIGLAQTLNPTTTSSVHEL